MNLTACTAPCERRQLRISPTQTLEVLRSDREVFEVETTYAPGGVEPPAHYHPHHDEHFEILAGTVHAVVDGSAIDLAAGEHLQVRRGQVHAFWNVAQEPARVRWTSRPATQVDSWFTGLAALVATAMQTGQDIAPDAFAAHLAAHRDTFRPAPP